MVMYADEATVETLPLLLGAFEPIALAEMDGVALLDRVDTKYVLGRCQLEETLEVLAGRYRLLEVDGVRLNRYANLYFDSPDLRLYQWHHAGRPRRYKVRSREYLDSNISFFEVKQKGKRDRTVKHRTRTPSLLTRVDNHAAGLVDERLAGEIALLGPTLWNRFSRVTLVDTAGPERVTLDFDLEFAWEDRVVRLPGVAIAEVKQSRRNAGSPFCWRMHTLGVRPGGFSKYCVGVALVYDGVKHNNFRPALRALGTLMEDYDVERAG